jgi:hypothetical protein
LQKIYNGNPDKNSRQIPVLIPQEHAAFYCLHSVGNRLPCRDLRFRPLALRTALSDRLPFSTVMLYVDVLHNPLFINVIVIL